MRGNGDNMASAERLGVDEMCSDTEVVIEKFE
jgi:hypothetical protein